VLNTVELVLVEKYTAVPYNYYAKKRTISSYDAIKEYNLYGTHVFHISEYELAWSSNSKSSSQDAYPEVGRMHKKKFNRKSNLGQVFDRAQKQEHKRQKQISSLR